jgi:hypothetical protein
MGMTATLEFLPIPAPVLERIRAIRHDEFGNAATPQTREAGLPLRCCLRLSRDGERVLLVAHRPSALGGPYAEVGPVFVHAEACGGYRTPDTFPAEFRDRRAILRPYDAEGLMLDGVLAEPGQSERLVRELLANPRVAQVQVRNVVAGCWNFTVRRAAA